MSPPLVEDDLPEDDGVLHEGEEDEQHAGQQPHLQRRHRVGHRDPGPEHTNLRSRKKSLMTQTTNISCLHQNYIPADFSECHQKHNEMKQRKSRR